MPPRFEPPRVQPRQSLAYASTVQGRTGQRLLSKAEIVQRLRGLPRYQGLTMKALAARTGLSRQALYDAQDGAISGGLQQLLSSVLAECQVQGSAEDPAQQAFPRQMG